MDSSDLKARTLDAIRARPSPPRPRLAVPTRALLMAAIFVPLVLFVMAGALRVGPRPVHLVLATAGGTFAIAAVVSWLALGRGGQMVGRSRTLLLFAALGAPAAMLAWKELFTALYVSGPWHTLGFRCFGLMFLFASVPLAAAVFVRRGLDPVHPRALGAAIGAACGSYAAALVDMWCPSGELPHVLFGHLAPLVVLVVAGGELGARFLAPR